VDAAIASKLKRLRSGAKPTVIDLFSGCGGMSLGFHRAGFDVLAGLDKDPEAALTHASNFHAGVGSELRGLFSRRRDITSEEPPEFLRQLDYLDPSTAVDVIIGGPPCQAYARRPCEASGDCGTSRGISD
jgi:DNA (cytosine-5)-methyltransferase 1